MDKNSSDERDDAKKKKAARRGAPAARPGAVSMSVNEAEARDQRIAEKSNIVRRAPQELGQLEQDLLAKQRGQAPDAALKPGAISSSSAKLSSSSAGDALTSLEADVAAKRRARGTPIDSLEQKVAAKIQGESR